MSDWEQPVYRLLNARLLSRVPGRKSSLRLIKLIRSQPQIFKDLLELDTSHPDGRLRLPGCWPLVMMCMVMECELIEPFWASKCDDEAFWKACGFVKIPSAKTSYNRLVELELYHRAFRTCAQKLIAQAQRHVPEIGTGVAIDCTEAGVYAALHYYGPNLDGLDELECAEAMREARRRGGGAKAMSAGEARQQRNEDVDDVDPERAPPIPPPGDVSRLATGDVSRVRTDTETLPSGRKRRWVYVLLASKMKGGQPVGGHWYRFLDTTAGVRFHRHGKFWLGFYNLKVVDICTGAVLLCLVESASINEFNIWLEHLDEVISHLGKAPRFVTADKGFAVRAVYEAHGTHRVASVFPPRETSFYRQDSHIDTHDHFGIPTCPVCGNPCHLVDFRSEEYAHYRYECSVNPEGKCGGRRRIACSTDPRRLPVGIHPMSLAWHEAAEAHFNLENPHHTWRLDYGVGGDDRNTRPRRKGQPWQQLMADVALVLEWLRVCQANGWLAGRSDRRPRRRDELVRPYLKGAVVKLKKKWATWLAEGLDLPRGRAGEQRYGPRGDPPPDAAGLDPALS